MCEIKNDETIVQRSIVHMGGADVAVVRRCTRQKSRQVYLEEITKQKKGQSVECWLIDQLNSVQDEDVVLIFADIWCYLMRLICLIFNILYT